MHFDVTTLDDVKADTNQSRWPCDARVIHARFAHDEIITSRLGASRGIRIAHSYILNSIRIYSDTIQTVAYLSESWGALSPKHLY